MESKGISWDFVDGLMREDQGDPPSPQLGGPLGPCLGRSAPTQSLPLHLFLGKSSKGAFISKNMLLQIPPPKTHQLSIQSHEGDGVIEDSQ
jgi:hypothetical protein